MSPERASLESIIATMGSLAIGSPMTWVYVWDTVKDKYENPDPEWKFISTLDQIWDDLWNNADEYKFSLQYGSESLEEAIDDWLSEKHMESIEE